MAPPVLTLALRVRRHLQEGQLRVAAGGVDREAVEGATPAGIKRGRPFQTAVRPPAAGTRSVAIESLSPECRPRTMVLVF